MENGYMKKTKSRLEALGFENTTHIIWVHKVSRMMLSVPYESTPNCIHELIAKKGADDFKKKLKSLFD